MFFDQQKERCTTIYILYKLLRRSLFGTLLAIYFINSLVDRKLYESLLLNLHTTLHLILIITNTVFLNSDYCSSLAFIS